MGVSTDGQICFGVLFEDGYEFPWDADEFEGFEEDWWRSVNGYIPLHKPYTEDGNYAPGWGQNDPRLDEHYKHKQAWEDEHPLPFELVNYCSGEYPMYILAIPGTVITAYRGVPVEIQPSLTIDKKALDRFNDLCAKFNIEFEQGPCWWLSSYWG